MQDCAATALTEHNIGETEKRVCVSLVPGFAVVVVIVVVVVVVLWREFTLRVLSSAALVCGLDHGDGSAVDLRGVDQVL